MSKSLIGLRRVRRHLAVSSIAIVAAVTGTSGCGTPQAPAPRQPSTPAVAASTTPDPVAIGDPVVLERGGEVQVRTR